MARRPWSHPVRSFRSWPPMRSMDGRWLRSPFPADRFSCARTRIFIASKNELDGRLLTPGVRIGGFRLEPAVLRHGVHRQAVTPERELETQRRTACLTQRFQRDADLQDLQPRVFE